MFFYSRVLPVSGAVPTPGKDMPEASWQQEMRIGEIALFNFDAKSGQLLGPKARVPQLPVQEVCMVFGSRYAARASARGQIAAHPQMLTVLYDRRGRWLSTRSREGETRRNPGLGLAWLLFQFPLMAIFGAVGVLLFSAIGAANFGTEPIRLSEMSSQQLSSLLTGGLLVGAFGRLLFELIRMRLIVWHGKPALAPVGSPEREKLYRRVAKDGGSCRLVPPEVSLVPATVEWPVPEKHAEWSAVLQSAGFQHLGQFVSPEVRAGHDFWFRPDQDLTAIVATLPGQGMWLAVFTRYEDGSSFCALNKLPTGMDLPPKRKAVYLGLEASAEALIEHVLENRPEGQRRRPTADNLLDDYKTGWRTSIEWRRARGTTAEEVKRVDERRGQPKAIGAMPRSVAE
jgi:hypothetical protein